SPSRGRRGGPVAQSRRDWRSVPSRTLSLPTSPPSWGEREGTRRVSDGEGEVGRSHLCPHLTPTLSAPRGGEGDSEFARDSLRHTPNVFHHIPIPESDHPIIVARNLEGSVQIVLS